MSSDDVQHAEQQPYCLAMMLCDAIHQDPQTGKFTLLGTFHGFRAASFPASIRFSVYFAITEVVGAHKLRFRIVNASEHIANDSEEPVMEIERDLQGPGDPLQVAEGILAIQQVTIPAAGVYLCELYSDDEPLMSRRLVAIGPG